MKVLVFGAGVIGTMHAWALERAGHSVSLLVRPGHEDRWTDGIRLQILDDRGGDKREVNTLFRPHIVTSFAASDGFDLVVDAVRYTQAEGALPELAAKLGDAILLVFHNNWRGLDFIDQVLPKERYVLGLPRAGGVISNGVLDGAFYGNVTLGTSTSGRPAAPVVDTAARKNLDYVASHFRTAGFEPEIQENMEHWYWVHFASTAAYTGAVAKEGGFAAFAESKKAIHECLLAGREAMEICQARGVNVRKIEDAKMFLTSPIVVAPLMRRAVTGDVTRRMSQTQAEYVPEFRRIYDDVVETAHQLHVDTPHLDAYRPYVDV